MSQAGSPASARCRIVAALEWCQGEDPDHVRQLAADAKSAGADAVRLPERAEAEPSDKSGSAVDVLAALTREPVEVDTLLAPFDLEAVARCRRFDFQGWKVEPALLTHLPLLEAIADDSRPVVIGVAGGTRRQLDQAVSGLRADTVLLHTVGLGGRAIDLLDVARMAPLRRYGHDVGYADGATDETPALLALALGATTVEKTLVANRSTTPSRSPGLLPAEFAAFVRRMRALERVLEGHTEDEPHPEEIDLLEKDAVSIVAARMIPRGTKLQPDMLTLKAPGTGLTPRFLPLIQGHRVLYDVPKGVPLTFGLIDP